MSEPMSLLSLPLFPLGSVLFPGGLLPLRIFEVRYLDMIAKCHKHHAPFGVVSLIEGSEVRRRADKSATGEPGGDGFAAETFNTVGTLARIDELSAPQPGLLTIRCSGLERFEIIRSERLKHGLWVADVQRIAADQAIAIPQDLRGVASALAGVFRSLEARGLPPEQMPVRLPHQLNDCAWVANRWCELLPMPQDAKQRLMALDNPLVRLELVSDMLARAGIAT